MSKKEILLPPKLNSIAKFLGNGFCRGIGPVRAKQIVQCFGEAWSQVLQSEPKKFLLIPGLKTESILNLQKAWQKECYRSSEIIFLLELGATKKFAEQIYNQYQGNTKEVIKQNPYLLCKDLHGVGFLKADKIALSFGISKTSNFRISAGIKHIFFTNLETGQAYLSIKFVTQELVKILNIENSIENQKLIEQNLEINLEKKEIIKIADDVDNSFLALSKAVHTEHLLAKKILNMLAVNSKNLNFNLSATFLELNSSLKNSQEKNLSDEQIEAICCALANKITIITGGPGTGKTTLLKKLVELLKKHNKTFLLLAPTGKAVKRLEQSTKTFAQTLHRALEINPIMRRFQKNEANPFKEEFIIVDEFSMVDMFLAASLFSAIHPVKSSIVIIGDIDQLPSVGAGKVLADLINSNKIKVIRLNKIFRQSGGSSISENTYRINSGLFPLNKIEDLKKDFIIKKEDLALNFHNHLVELFKTKLPKENISAHQSIVLTPMHKGESGSIKTNRFLQNFLNSQSPKSLTFFENEFRIGDPIIVQKNNYEKMVFNGDTGIIKEIIKTDNISKVLIDFGSNRVVEFAGLEISNISLAYAISIHKSQGSEFDCAIIPVFTEHFMMLNRKILYTAVSRAKKLCILIGQYKALAIAIKNTKEQDRKTFLKEFLCSNFRCS